MRNRRSWIVIAALVALIALASTALAATKKQSRAQHPKGTYVYNKCKLAGDCAHVPLWNCPPDEVIVHGVICDVVKELPNDTVVKMYCWESFWPPNNGNEMSGKWFIIGYGSGYKTKRWVQSTYVFHQTSVGSC